MKQQKIFYTLFIIITATALLWGISGEQLETGISCTEQRPYTVFVAAHSTWTSICRPYLRNRVYLHYTFEMDDKFYSNIRLRLHHTRNTRRRTVYNKLVTPNRMVNTKVRFRYPGTARFEIINEGDTDQMITVKLYFTSKGIQRYLKILLSLLFPVFFVILVVVFFPAVKPLLDKYRLGTNLSLPAFNFTRQIYQQKKAQQKVHELQLVTYLSPMQVDSIMKSLPFEVIQHILGYVKMELAVNAPSFNLTFNQKEANERTMMKQIFGRFHDDRGRFVFQVFTNIDFYGVDEMLQTQPYLLRLKELKGITMYTVPETWLPNTYCPVLESVHIPINVPQVSSIVTSVAHLKEVGVTVAHLPAVNSMKKIRRLTLYDQLQDNNLDDIYTLPLLESLTVSQLTNNLMVDIVNKTMISELVISSCGTLFSKNWNFTRTLNVLQLDSPVIVTLQVPIFTINLRVLKLGANIRLDETASFQNPLDSSSLLREIYTEYPLPIAFYRNLRFFPKLEALKTSLSPRNFSFFRMLEGMRLKVIIIDVKLEQNDKTYATNMVRVSDAEIRSFFFNMPSLRTLSLFEEVVYQEQFTPYGERNCVATVMTGKSRFWTEKE